ncbi:3-hydroxybutyryl-CoA dehydrogenase-like isoform X2 [Lytechinus pictus]|uniref:3-hydroxybutyryl-CoA dehydrogenase-like isoform X2 n=1 Tax=Lytechinus pictus TaxID=7653 RepID=UPI0030B9B634
MVKIAVLGCGLMGTKIAGCMAYHGHRVKIFDVNASALSVVQENLDQDKDELHRDGLMTHPKFLGQVLCMSRLEDAVDDAEFIFEAVIEDLDVKKELFERLTQMCKPDAIIGSNSLQCNIDEVAERANCKERIMNLRFLHPVYTIPEVEITTTRHTTPNNVEKVRQLLEKMGKTLFYRSGKEPLILSAIQIASRKLARRQQILRQRGLAGFPQNDVPGLGHDGNTTPMQDDECATSNEFDCAICMDRKRDCLLCPCHHLVTCHECAKSLVNRQDCCPICRKEISEIIRVFTA